MPTVKEAIERLTNSVTAAVREESDEKLDPKVCRQLIATELSAHAGTIAAIDRLDSDGIQYINGILEKRQNREGYILAARYAGAVNKVTTLPGDNLGIISRIYASAVSCRKFLDGVYKNFNDLYDVSSDHISVNNLRMSHAVIWGTINQVRDIGTVNRLVLDAIVMTASGAGMDTLRKYQLKFVNDHMDEVCRNINLMTKRQGIVTLQADIERMRKANKDPHLVVSGEVNPHLMIPVYYLGIIIAILTGVVSVNMVRLGQEAWVNFKQWRHREITKTRDNTQRRVDLLRSEMYGMSPDSAEYQQQKDVIERYEDMIRKDNKKIQEYLEK